MRSSSWSIATSPISLSLGGSSAAFVFACVIAPVDFVTAPADGCAPTDGAVGAPAVVSAGGAGAVAGTFLLAPTSGVGDFLVGAFDGTLEPGAPADGCDASSHSCAGGGWLAAAAHATCSCCCAMDSVPLREVDSRSRALATVGKGARGLRGHALCCVPKLYERE